MIKLFWGLVLAAGLVSSALATSIQADANKSVLAFSGKHTGMTFKGRFEKWQAELVLPPAENPSISAEFNTVSATTGDSTYDETLLEGDWFDVENHPIATFTSTDIKAKGNDFEVKGKLSIKDKSHEVELLLKQKGKGYKAEFAIDRLAFGIGIESDPDAEWVSRLINMQLTISSN